MKRRAFLSIFLILAMLFTLTACIGQGGLSAPEQLRLTNETHLKWNSVGGAERYAILIDGYEEATTDKTEFDLGSLSLNAGQSYTVSVKALGNGTLADSTASQSLTYTHKKTSTDTPEPPSTSADNPSTETPEGSLPIFNTHDDFFYIAHPSDTIEIEYAFTDNEYRYYYFYLGYLENFPLVYSPSQYIIPNGTSITFSKSMHVESIDSIEEAVSDSVSVTEAQSTSWSKELGVKFAFEGVKIFKAKADVEVEAKTGVTDTWENSETRSHTLTHTVAKSMANGITETVSQTFDANAPKGHYRYVRYAKRCDVYVLTVHDPKTNDYGWTYVTFADDSVKNMGETIEFSTEGTFSSDRENQLRYDEDKCLSCIDPKQTLPYRSTGTPSETYAPISIPMTSVLCAENKDYDPNQTYNNDYKNNGAYDHGSYTVGTFVLYGCWQNKDGSLKIVEPDKFKIEFVFDQDPTRLPNEKNNELYVTSDTAKNVFDTDIRNGDEIGKGAYYIVIKLKNGSSLAPITGLNFMDNKTKGSVITILDNFNLDTQEIASIRIVAVYELQYYAGWFDHHFTNWRFDRTVTFQ